MKHFTTFITNIFMKKILAIVLLAVLVCSTSVTYGQSAKEMLAEIEGKWELDDNGNITFTRIVDAPELSKDEIYNRVLSYFTYNYGSGKSVIQTQDKEAGLVVGKGLYDNVHVGVSIITTTLDAWHILRVDAKEGRARVIITLTDYDKKVTGGSTPPNYSSSKIASEYPINEKGIFKTVMSKAFYKSYKHAFASLDRVEKAIKDGNTSKSLESSEW
jgi:hypothetical protein